MSQFWQYWRCWQCLYFRRCWQCWQSWQRDNINNVESVDIANNFDIVDNFDTVDNVDIVDNVDNVNNIDEVANVGKSVLKCYWIHLQNLENKNRRLTPRDAYISKNLKSSHMIYWIYIESFIHERKWKLSCFSQDWEQTRCCSVVGDLVETT